MNDVTSVGLITSAAYVNLELAAEYGPIPPTFLPFGHRRLYQAQVDTLRPFANRIILTLPASFAVPAADQTWLDAACVEVLHLPDGLSLGDSVAQALILGAITGAVRLLHGDTLLPDLDQSHVDSIAVARPQAGYNWGQMPDARDSRSEEVLAGWFSFSDAAALLRALTRADGDFITALDSYAAILPLKPVHADNWLDFGHLQTFHRARTHVNTARAFNRLAITKRTVFKSGDKPAKLRNEAAWFAAIPPQMRIFTPTFLGAEAEGYRIAYEFNPTLHELLIFGALGTKDWEVVAGGCFEFFDACHRYGKAGEPDDEVIERLATIKTEHRIMEWARTGGISPDLPWELNGVPLPTIRQIIEQTTALIRTTAPLPGVMHGDFCFPNVFFDFRQQIVRVIDPRGSVDEENPSVHGDIRYDLAKLTHSIEGYDQILTGRYSHRLIAPQRIEFALADHEIIPHLRQVFAGLEIAGQRISDPGIRALTIQLFLSMLPLHADRPDRQAAFLANALRLFATLDTNTGSST